MSIVVFRTGGNPNGGSGPVISPPGTIAQRPSPIDGALQTFTETTLNNSIRSQSDDNQLIKTRLRATNQTRTADATVTVRAELVSFWQDWFDDDCRGGTLPTRFRIPPSCSVEEVWRFAAPPSYDWGIDQSAKACKISLKLEQLPNWAGL